MGGPTSSIRYRHHSSWDHVTTQAPPLHQSRDTFGGGGGAVIKLRHLILGCELHPFYKFCFKLSVYIYCTLYTEKHKVRLYIFTRVIIHASFRGLKFHAVRVQTVFCEAARAA
jgi:hypothetical protein